MARLVTAGCETNEVSATSGVEGIVAQGGGSFAPETTILRSGKYSFRVNSGASNVTEWMQTNTTVSFANPLYIQTALYLETLPSSTLIVLKISPGDLIHGFSIRITSSGAVQLFNDSTGLQIGSDAPILIAANEWHIYELFAQFGAGATDSVEARLDLSSFVLGSGLESGFTTTDNGGIGCGIISTGAYVASKNIYIDDFIINDNTGGSENSWPGGQKVVMLFPISDNARATLWTGGVGGTSNLFAAVDNAPPVGTATETNTTQIEHGGGAAGTTDAYDANMGAYSDTIASGGGGMSAIDIVKVIQYIIVTGEDVATGTKLLAIAGVSNPVVAQGSSFDVFATSGALGTYPTNWTIKKDGLALQYNPTVTLTTKPVMRVVRPETASRVASVCFMGMMVSYLAGEPFPAGYRQPQLSNNLNPLLRM